MSQREWFPIVSVCGMFVVLVLGLPAPVRAECPAGWSSCFSGDSTMTWCNPPGTECGTPDSSSIECTGVCDVEVMLTATVRTMEMDIMAPAAPKARIGSQLETIVRTDRSAPFEASVVLEGEGRWAFRAAAVGARTPAAATVRLKSGGRTLATRSVVGRAHVAESPAFPSGIAVATSSRVTSITWTYSAPVSVRLSDAGAVEADAIEIGFASGATGPLRALALHSIGIGPLAAGPPEWGPTASGR